MHIKETSPLPVKDSPKRLAVFELGVTAAVTSILSFRFLITTKTILIRIPTPGAGWWVWGDEKNVIGNGQNVYENTD